MSMQIKKDSKINLPRFLDIKNTKRAPTIITEIYRRLYKASEPSVDFDKLLSNSNEVLKPDFYLDYYIDRESYEKIINETLKEFKVAKKYWHIFLTHIDLGISPTNVKKD